MENKKNGLLIPIIVGAVLLVAAIVLAIFLLLPGDDKAPDQGDKAPDTGSVSGTVTVEILTEGNKALSGIGVYVYSDSALSELIWFEKTGDDGKISFEAENTDKLYTVLKDVPEGYEYDDSYEIKDNNLTIVLKTVLVSQDDLTDVKYNKGDVIGDFSVTDIDGTEYTMSALLKEKKAVMLFFWQMESEACREQLAYLNEAFAEHKDNIAVLAMNPIDKDSAAVGEFKEENELSLPLALCEADWINVFSIDKFPTAVVVDQYGVVTLIQRGALPNTDAYNDIFDFFADDDYVQSDDVDVDNITDTTLDTGSSGNPVEIGGVEYFDVTVLPGKVVYYNIYKITNQYISIADPAACFVYQGETLRAENGVVGISLASSDPNAPVSIGIGNASSEEKTFRVRLTFPKGTHGNPYSLELTTFATTVAAGNDQGVYYNYFAKEDGYLTVSCLKSTPGVTYLYTLYNLSSYAFVTSDSDGTVGGDGSVSLKVKVRAGDKVQLSIASVSKDTEMFPRCDFTSKASFKSESFKDEEVETIVTKVYAVTVTDQDRKPIAGAKVRFIGADGMEYTLSSDENGVAGAKLVPGTYKAVLSLPAGYRANTTEFTLTEKIPVVSVMLRKTVVAVETYTVKLVDEEGAPLAGVTVFVGDRFVSTDASGVAVFSLAKGTYTCVVALPDGYTAETTSYPFGGSTSITVTLTKGAGSEEDDANKMDYTVKVTDYNGKPMKNVAVKFMKGDSLSAMATTDANGVATARLTKGNYTASLAFDKNGFCYVDATALTEASPVITVRVASAVSGEVEELYVGDAYVLPVGGTYVETQSNVVNYFVFKPTEAGVYRFKTSDRAAILSYWGGNVHFLEDVTANTNYSENTFSISVRESAVGVVFTIGVTGVDSCIVEIVRTGDALVDEYDLPWDIYVPAKEPTKYTLSLGAGQKLNYVDVTASTSAYTLVYNETDGYYHFNSANGPVALINLGENAPYLSMKTLLDSTAIRKYFYDENGAFVKKEDYTDCMTKYVASIDEKHGVCPLTKDLVYIINQRSSWWNPDSYDYLFGELEGLNPEIAWMFLLCYVG